MKDAVINYMVYKDNNRFVGISETTLPDLTRTTAEVSGTGLSGKMNVPLVGQMEPMTLTLNFRAPSTEQAELAAGGQQLIELRAAVQGRNDTTGEIEITPVKIIMRVMCVSHKPGKVAAASTTDASGEYAVSYYAEYHDNKKMAEIDIVNGICYFNGKDEMSEVRAALGLS